MNIFVREYLATLKLERNLSENTIASYKNDLSSLVSYLNDSGINDPAEIKSKNIQQHLLSAYEQNNLNNILEHFGIINYFQFIVGLDNIYAGGKSHLAQDLAIKIRSNGSIGNILLIGDTIHDYEVAKEINSDCILLSHGHQDEERLLQIGIPVVKDIKELSNMLKEL